MDNCSCPEVEGSEAIWSNSVTMDDNSLDLNSAIRILGEGRCIEHSEDENEDEEDNDDFLEQELLAQMGYAKGKAKPKRNTREHQRQYQDKEEEEEEEGLFDHSSDEPPKHDPVTASVAEIKLVSALKGSREKAGKPPRACRVSWAPDVYDPSPSAEHCALNGAERQNCQRSGKGVGTSEGRGKGSKGRGKAARKDKKQAKKHGRGSKRPDYGES